MTEQTPSDFRSSAIRAIRIERDAIDALEGRIDDQFTRACEVIMNCKGRVVVTGMGKSGHIGNKIAAPWPALERHRFSCTRARQATVTWV